MGIVNTQGDYRVDDDTGDDPAERYGGTPHDDQVVWVNAVQLGVPYVLEC